MFRDKLSLLRSLVHVALSDNLNDSMSAYLEDMFSTAILNAKFDPSEKRTQPPPRARDSLKQMWEENCARADNIGLDAVKKLESTMNEFSNRCNEWSRKNDLLMQHGKCKNIPMTQGQYQGTAKRIFNTHHML
jgi:hypothetical protein